MSSPFFQSRFEYDHPHYYYLPRKCFNELEMAKPSYLIGARGSGKTTLLKSLDWRERLENPTLVRALDNKPFAGQYIGTYLKLPTIQLGAFDYWLQDHGIAQQGSVLGLYFDLIAIEMFAHAIGELIVRDVMTCSATEERLAVRDWINKNHKLVAYTTDRKMETLSDFKLAIQTMRGDLEDAAMTGGNFNSIVERYPLGQIGHLVKQLSVPMAQCCTRWSVENDGEWHFKLCMDEGECLTQAQLLTINTLVRLAEWPFFPIVSFVGFPNDISTTLVPNLTHQVVDRQLIVLDDMSNSEFRELAEGVATVRIREMHGHEVAPFQTANVLGRLNLNRLLQGALEKSESPLAAELLEQATRFSAEWLVDSYELSDDLEIGEVVSPHNSPIPLPICEAYLASELELVPKNESSRRELRRVESTEFRKKMVAAYLSICREVGLRNVPYTSADMVLQLCDTCVRDYLAQLHEIFVEFDEPLERFLRTRIPDDVQAAAIRRASEKKRDSIPDSGALSPVESGRLIKGLCLLTAMLQSGSVDNKHLRSSERGRFKLRRKDEPTSAVVDMYVLIQDSADSGFIRIERDGGQIGTFRAHASLAAAYNFSYRGAYYVTQITIEELERFRTASSEQALVEAAKAVNSRLAGSEESGGEPIRRERLLFGDDFI